MVKSKVSPRSGSSALRQLKAIHKRATTGFLQLSAKVFPAFFLKSSIFPSNFSKKYVLFSSTEA